MRYQTAAFRQDSSVQSGEISSRIDRRTASRRNIRNFASSNLCISISLQMQTRISLRCKFQNLQMRMLTNYHIVINSLACNVTLALTLQIVGER